MSTDQSGDNSVPGQSPDPSLDDSSAADLIRQKLDRIYSEEPDAFQELSEAKEEVLEGKPPSKHQQFMYALGTSGKDLATVQTEWHNYYQGLSDKEKHQVWQEFYASQSTIGGQATTPVATETVQETAAPKAADSSGVTVGSGLSDHTSAAQKLSEHKQNVLSGGKRTDPRRRQAATGKLRDVRTKAEVKAAILNKVSAGGKLEARHHLQSLLFGLATGAVVIFIFMFGFFNQVVIAPFIQPGSVNADAPLIISSDTIAPTPTPEVIIPKINVEIPVDYSETSTSESAIESDLNSGVVHYPTTSVPGQDGNAAFFGHSSNNIFNPGKYKFAFVLLHTLVNGDTFYLTYNDKVYAYKVISHTIVSPSDVSVLNPVPGQTATATLITCDPPGTSINRLIVVGQQISPDPSANNAPPAATTTASSSSSSTPSALPNDGPSFWGSLTKSLTGEFTIALCVLVLVLIVFRKALASLLWAS